MLEFLSKLVSANALDFVAKAIAIAIIVLAVAGAASWINTGRLDIHIVWGENKSEPPAIAPHLPDAWRRITASESAEIYRRLDSVQRDLGIASFVGLLGGK